MVKTHYLKCWPSYYDAVASGAKTFEVRRDDRGFQRGDLVVLMRTYESASGLLPYPTVVEPAPVGSGRKAKHELTFEIGYVLHGSEFGLRDGFCAFSLVPAFLNETEPPPKDDSVPVLSTRIDWRKLSDDLCGRLDISRRWSDTWNEYVSPNLETGDGMLKLMAGLHGQGLGYTLSSDSGPTSALVYGHQRSVRKDGSNVAEALAFAAAEFFDIPIPYAGTPC